MTHLQSAHRTRIPPIDKSQHPRRPDSSIHASGTAKLGKHVCGEGGAPVPINQSMIRSTHRGRAPQTLFTQSDKNSPMPGVYVHHETESHGIFNLKISRVAALVGLKRGLLVLPFDTGNSQAASPLSPYIYHIPGTSRLSFWQ